MKITFLADIMCEPPVLKAAKRKGGKYDFSGVFAHTKGLISESDFVVGNLETPLAGAEAGYTDTHVRFNAPDEYADALIEAGVDLISTANNHTFDRGYEGMERTVKVLDEKGIAHIGSYLRGAERPEAYYIERDGVRYAFIAYTYGTNYRGSGGECLADGEYEGTVNLLCPQNVGTYLPGEFRAADRIDKLFKRFGFKGDPNVPGKLKKLFGMTSTYSRHDDRTEGKIDNQYTEKFMQDIRAAKEKADFVFFYPHVGGQFNVKPGAFSEYVVKKAVEAGADAVVATHSHIPQKFEFVDGVPCAYCLGNFNMNPESYLAMPEILTNYGYALHLYVEDGKLSRVSFSMLKNYVNKDGQISSYPVDELYASLKSDKEKEALEKEIKYLYGRVAGKILEGDVVRREYLL